MSCDEPRHQAAMEQLVTFDTSGSPTDRDHHESALRGTRYKATIFRHEIELDLAKTHDRRSIVPIRVKALADFDHQMER